jgi:excinuclease ABC subunit A
LCDFGPRAGRNGGRIVARGAPDAVTPIDQSVTAGYINGTRAIPIPSSRRPVVSSSGQPLVNHLKVTGAREHNLRNVDLELPLGVFTAITGPSGSGKSSLIEGILYPALARRLHRARLRVGRHEKIEGLRFIDKVIEVDQSALGNTPSSNPGNLHRRVRPDPQSVRVDSGSRRAKVFGANVQFQRCRRSLRNVRRQRN